MSAGVKASRLKALFGRIRDIGADRRGVAAVEFAIIAPLLLSMYFVTMEVSQGIETNKKVGRVGSMVADLVTQQQEVTRADLDAIMQIGEATMQPYNRSRATIKITGIQITTDTTPQARVTWWRKLEDGAASGAAPTNETTTVPATLMVPGSFLVRVESSLAYRPVITWAAADKPALGLTAAFDGIPMAETYYLRPRMSPQVKCLNC